MHAKTLAIISPSLVPTPLHGAHRLTYYRAGFAKSQHARPMTQGLSLRVIHPRRPGAMLDCKGQHAYPPSPLAIDIKPTHSRAKSMSPRSANPPSRPASDASMKERLPANLPMRSTLT